MWLQAASVAALPHTPGWVYWGEGSCPAAPNTSSSVKAMEQPEAPKSICAPRMRVLADLEQVRGPWG